MILTAMRRLLGAYVVALSTFAVSNVQSETPVSPAAEAFYPVEDHLVPISLDAEKEVRGILEKELLVSAQPCARMLERPSSTGETGISICRGDANGSSPTFEVTCVRAKENIWYAQSPSNPGRSKRPVEMNRVRVPLSESTGRAIFEVWRQMLSRTRGYDYKGEFREPVGGTVFEFSIVEPNAQSLYGESPLLDKNPNKQPLVTTLIRIGHKLTKYCEIDARHRAQLAKEIEFDLNELASHAGERQ
jgi:hypothetical protein